MKNLKPKPSAVEPVKGEAYTTCEDLPFYNFIKLSVTGSNNWLIKSGQPENLEKIAQDILSEYTELSGDVNTNKALKCLIRVSMLQNRILIVNKAVDYLRYRRFQPLIDELKKMGFRWNLADHDKNLDGILTALKMDQIKLEKYQDDYDKLTKSGTATNESFWYDRLSAIAKYRQVPSINPRLISVMEFISMDKDFNNYISYLKSKQINGR